MSTTDLRLMIISGLSGAGKSQVNNYLEDIGFFCIDNLPPYLLPSLVEQFLKENSLNKLAVVMDIRGELFLRDINKALSALDKLGVAYEIVFMETSNRGLIARYKMSRRRHPLIEEANGDILQAITSERELLEEMREKANRIIDTTSISILECRKIIDNIVGDDEVPELLISIYSFGYKYGLPMDADLVIDVRFLPNPFYIDSLRFLTGEEKRVSDYVFSFEETKEFLDKYVDLLKFLVPKYIKEGKRQLVIAIGCTGGQHRSVAVSKALEEKLHIDGVKTCLYHREMWRYKKGDEENVL